jgi:hypothetical protein
MQNLKLQEFFLLLFVKVLSQASFKYTKYQPLKDILDPLVLRVKVSSFTIDDSSGVSKPSNSISNHYDSGTKNC